MDDLGKTLESNADEWGSADGGSTKKIMYRVSALPQFDLNSWFSNILLDSAASVHVFNIKEKFSNFNRALKDQSLLCGSNVISIVGWKQISLPLKVKGQIELLTLNNMAYISNFLLNFVSLGCLQQRGFDWSHFSGKISKNNQIIGYTRFHSKDYKIGDDKNGGIVFATLGTDPATPRKSQPYHRPYFAVISDIWHRKMGHIGPLGLHMLGKGCLGVRLRWKMMSQVTHCVVSKISQQVSRQLQSNRSTRSFLKVYIDSLNLEYGWDSHQGNRALVR